MSNTNPLNISRYGPFYLTLEFNKSSNPSISNPIPIEPQQIKEFTITLDINHLLPSFRLVFNDSSGIMTHNIPFDHNLSRLHVRIARQNAGSIDETTDFSFNVFGRYPRSDYRYEIEGLLMIDNLFSPKKVRGFGGTIKDTLAQIGNEIGTDNQEISTSLNYVKNILQPGWSNAKLLNYLKQNVIGRSKETAFYTFVKCVKTKTTFVFKSLKDFLSVKPKYTFTLAADVFQDVDSGETFYPILEYRMFDNYKLIGLSGVKSQDYVYYDYDLGKPMIKSVLIDGNDNRTLDFRSLTRYYLIDKDDKDDEQIALMDTGRTNDFSGNFESRAINIFHKSVMDLSKVWIDSVGLEDVYPGDIVKIELMEQGNATNPFGCHYQGLWMVERVVHIMGQSYITRMLLTRNGTDIESKVREHNLLPAESWVKNG